MMLIESGIHQTHVLAETRSVLPNPRHQGSEAVTSPAILKIFL